MPRARAHNERWRNERLAQTLHDLGWSVARLTREVNREIGRDYVSRSTASEWVNISRVPRQPLPTIVAHVLSQAGGVHLPISELWPGTPPALGWVPADQGMQVPWDLTGTKALARDWFINGESFTDSDRRSFMAVSGRALTMPAWEYVSHLRDVFRDSDVIAQFVSSGSGRIPSAIVDLLRSTVAHLRRIDDLEGGGNHVLSIVHGELRRVAGYLRGGSFGNSKVACSVLGVFAQLAQLAGWVAHDAERHGLAQRYFRTALQAAHSSGDRNIAAHVLGWMAYHAAYCGQRKEATELAELGVRVAKGGSEIVRSLANIRLAHAHAASAELGGFRAATYRARQHWSRLSHDDEPPSFLYWYDSSYVDILSSESLQVLAQGSERSSAALLQEANLLLADKIDRNRAAMPRDGLFHGLCQARGYVRLGDAERLCVTTRKALSNMCGVSSPRVVSTLRRLDKELGARRVLRELPEIAELRRELRLAAVSG